MKNSNTGNLRTILLLVAIYFFISFLFPATWNWGVISGLIPQWLSIAIISFIILVTIIKSLSESIYRAISDLLLRIHNSLSTLPKLIQIVLWILIPGTVFYLLRSEVLIHGDGHNVAGNLAAGKLPTLTAYGYSRILQAVYDIAGFGSVEAAVALISAMSMISGIVFLFFLYKSLNLLITKKTTLVLVFALLCCSMIIVQFMGHVETYPFAIMWISIYVYLSLRFLKLQNNPAPVFITFIIGIFWHVWFMAFLPSLLFLVNNRYRIVSDRLLAALSLVYVLLIYISGLIVERNGYSITNPILPNQDTGYSLFSPDHLLDFGNLLVFIGPVIPLIVIVMLVYKGGLPGSNQAKFMISLTIAPLIISFCIDPIIGAIRDWDLFMFFFVPAYFMFALYIAHIREKEPKIACLLIPAILLSLFHTSLFVAANKKPPLVVDRIVNVLLEDTHYKEDYYNGSRLRSFANILTREYGRPGDAKAFYSQVNDYSKLEYADLVSAANSFHNVGDFEQAANCYQLANSRNPLALNHRFAYGHSLVRLNKYDDALDILNPMTSDTSFVDLFFLIGVSYANQYEIDSSKKYFGIALEMSPEKIEALRTFVNIYSSLKKYAVAAQYQKRLVRYVPNSDKERLLLIRLFEQAGMPDSAAYYKTKVNF